MVVFYYVVLFFLRICQLLTQARARSLEKAYSKIALRVKEMAGVPELNDRKNNKVDLFQTAKMQYELGRLVEQKDRMEAKHFAWQQSAEKMKSRVDHIQKWHGRKVPYVMGMIDLAVLLTVLNALQYIRIDASVLIHMLESSIAN